MMKNSLEARALERTLRTGTTMLLTWCVAPLLGCAAQDSGHPAVRPGIEVLLSDSLHLVQGKRVGLITNQTGVDRAGVGDVERLLEEGVDLRAVFAPEHGFRGTLDQEMIQHGRDTAAGLPVFSLYGGVRAPTPEMLDLTDVLLIDLQDTGARPYTYVSTALVAIQAAAEAGVKPVLLDRPNPLGGTLVQGPMLDTAYTSSVGMLPVPLRHGMTQGELARLGNDVLGYGADLTVVPALGWQRDAWFDETGLPWVRPSPNMPDLESATHYPGIVLFEGTNLSVGRGTPVAFRVLGAPWLAPYRVAAELGSEPGVTVTDSVITPHAPGDGKYADVTMPALVFAVTDRRSYNPTRFAVRLMAVIRDLHPDSFEIRNAEYFDHRAGSDALRLWLDEGETRGEIWRSWEAGLAGFLRLREEYLVYR